MENAQDDESRRKRNQLMNPQSTKDHSSMARPPPAGSVASASRWARGRLVCRGFRVPMRTPAFCISCFSVSTQIRICVLRLFLSPKVATPHLKPETRHPKPQTGGLPPGTRHPKPQNNREMDSRATPLRLQYLVLCVYMYICMSNRCVCVYIHVCIDIYIYIERALCLTSYVAIISLLGPGSL